MNIQNLKGELESMRIVARQVRDEIVDAAYKNHTNYDEAVRDEIALLLKEVAVSIGTAESHWWMLERTSPSSRFFCFRLRGDKNKVEEKI